MVLCGAFSEIYDKMLVSIVIAIEKRLLEKLVMNCGLAIYVDKSENCFNIETCVS